jgi:hypothetical protein
VLEIVEAALPSTIGYEPELDVITVTLSGCFTLDCLKAVTREVLTRAQENPTRRVLVDSSRLEETMPVTDILSMIADYRTAGVDHSIRIAAIKPDLVRLHDDFRFFETASRNRGFNVRLFPNRGEALGWLGNGGE